MAVLIDSYNEVNYSVGQTMSSSFTARRYGQSFTGDGSELDSVKFYFIGSSAVGTLTALIYAHTGTFGSTGTPTGSILATSDTVDASTIPGSLSLVTFTFSGANRITLSNGTKYVLVCSPSGLSSGAVNIYSDNTSPTHAGNYSYYNGTSWSADSNLDRIFYVYGADPSGQPFSKRIQTIPFLGGSLRTANF